MLIFTFSLTLSSAAVFKLRFYGILLRSKTIKAQLKNCPAPQVRCWNDLLEFFYYLHLPAAFDNALHDLSDSADGLAAAPISVQIASDTTRPTTETVPVT